MDSSLRKCQPPPAKGFRVHRANNESMQTPLSRRHLLLGAAAPLIGLRKRTTWHAGASRIRITPQNPLWQAGYAARTRASEGTLQEVYVRALALDDGSGIPAVIVASDILGFPRSVADRIARAAHSRFGIRRDRLILNSSHTHGGPVVGDTLRIAYHATPQQWRDVFDYTARLESMVVDCIEQSLTSLRPANVFFGRTRGSFAANRRQPNGPVDHDVPILKVTDSANKPLALVFTYACHTTTLGGDEYRFHGDYAGYAQDYLEARNPSAVALYIAGCGGDANPSPRGRLQHVIEHGTSLGQAVHRALDSAEVPIEGAIKSAFGITNLDFATPPNREVLRARLADRDQYIQRHARMMLDILDRRGKLPEWYPYPIQAWRFGNDLTLIPMAGEVVVDYALRFKRELNPEWTWVAGYSNDVPAYIPSLRVLKEGGYEGGGAMIYYGQPGPFAESVEETIFRATHRLVRSL